MRAYDLDDYGQIKGWFEARKMNYPSLKSIPSLGFIIDDVAAGFLIETNTCICYLDFFITNPAIDGRKRKSALDEITQALLSRAGRLGYSGAMATTMSEKIAKRAIKSGFGEIGLFRTFYRSLNHG